MEMAILMGLERKIQTLDLECKELEDKIEKKLTGVEDSLANLENLRVQPDKQALRDIVNELKAVFDLCAQLKDVSNDVLSRDEEKRYDELSKIAFNRPGFAPLRLLYEHHYSEELQELSAFGEFIKRRYPYIDFANHAEWRAKGLANNLDRFVAKLHDEAKIAEADHGALLSFATMISSTMADTLHALGEEMSYDSELNALPQKLFEDVMAHPDFAKEALGQTRDMLKRGA